MAGVTSVGVLPTHRRRGILTALMRRQLQDVREHGEPVAALYASEGLIYGRFGYGLGTLAGQIEADSRRATFVDRVEGARTGSMRLVDRDEALREIPRVYDRLRSRRVGMAAKSDAWWEHDYADLERWRNGASALFYLLHEGPAGIDGYAVYRIKGDWPDDIPASTVRVRDLAAETAEAYAALWRFVFDLDLMTKVQSWGRPADEPLVHMVAEPARLRFRLADGLFVRLVDVAGALAGRSYDVEGSLVLDVRDAFCPWNEGRYLLEGGPDGATCEPTDRAPDLVLSATDLGAAYLGGTGLRTLADAGRVREVRAGSLHLAARMFATDRAPWCPFHF
jgi:predicted acetyltransferase